MTSGLSAGSVARAAADQRDDFDRRRRRPATRSLMPRSRHDFAVDLDGDALRVEPSCASRSATVAACGSVCGS